MKLMKIFGMVFALHVALACVIVLIQGCRSTPARTPDAVPAADAPPVEPAEPVNWTNQPSDAGSEPIDFSPEPERPVNEPLVGPTPAERARTQPTRPPDPAAYVSTGIPAAIAPPPPEPVDYVVRAGDSFWKIARANDTTVREIQRLNPNVRADALRPGMIIKLPGTPTSPLPNVPAGSSSRVTSTAATSTYVVRPGDSLSKIAARNGTTVAALREANNLRSDLIQVGQTLMIPGGGAEAGAPRAVSGPGTPPLDAAGQMTITIERGDTLGEIAQRYDVTVRDLMSANNITDPRKVRAGQTLIIPGYQAVGTGAIPPPTERPPRTSAPPAQPAEPAEEPPPDEEPAESTRPPELDAPPDDVSAPPVLPLDDPVPAP